MSTEFIEELVIPTKELATVLDWIKAEQVRVIQKDRTLGFNKIQKVDWLTETAQNLSTLQDRAEADQGMIIAKNNDKKWRIEREKQGRACICTPGCACNTQ